MIENLWSILCKQSIIDRTTNNVSIIEALEELKINVDIPKNSSKEITTIDIPIEYEFISLWKRIHKDSMEEYSLQLEISDPDKKIIKTFNQKMILQPGIKRYRSIFKISGFSATKNGEYIFKIETKKDKNIVSSKIPLEVNIIKTSFLQEKQ
jgi:hypothetical protein